MSEHDRLRGAGELAHWQIDNFMAAITATTVTVFSNSFTVGPVGPSYQKDGWGRVQVNGQVVPGTLGQAALTLPVGYRPPTNRYFATLDANGDHAAVYVTTAGAVVVMSGSTWVALDPITFYAG